MTDQNKEIRPASPAVNPWPGMLVRPRSTICWLLDNETQQSARMLWLSFTALFIATLFLALMVYPADFDRATVRIRLVLATPVLFLLSYLYFIAESYLLYRVSAWFGGGASQAEMRIVNAYTTVIPGVILGLVNVGLSVLFGSDSPLVGFAGNLIVGWSIYITAAGIAAAEGFAPWKGLVVYLITLAVWMGLAMSAGTLWFGQLPSF